MGIGNLFVTVFLSYFTLHILVMLIFKKSRVTVQTANKKLDVLRKIPIKTVAQQKEFINTRYPKRKGKFKWSWAIIPKIILRVACFIVIILTYREIFNFFNIDIKLWQAILFIVIFPFFLNLILEKFKVQKSDLSVFLR